METLAYEECCICDSETGRAGIGEDSLYTNDDGPFCEDCYDQLMKMVIPINLPSN